jgi:hypothetical protein
MPRLVIALLARSARSSADAGPTETGSRVAAPWHDLTLRARRARCKPTTPRTLGVREVRLSGRGNAVAPEVLEVERPQHVSNVSPASLGDIVDMRAQLHHVGLRLVELAGGGLRRLAVDASAARRSGRRDGASRERPRGHATPATRGARDHRDHSCAQDCTPLRVCQAIGILVEVARRLGMGFISARAEMEKSTAAAKMDAPNGVGSGNAA